MPNSQKAKRKEPERELPHSLEAEQGVLGCVLLEPAQCLPAVKAKGHNLFHDIRHQLIWRVLLDMEPETISVISVLDKLKQRRKLDDAGGMAYVAGLPDSAPSASNLDYHLKIVWERFQVRRVLQTCREVESRCYGYTGDTDELLWSIQSDFATAVETQSDLPSMDDAATMVLRHTPEPARLIDHILHVGSKLCIGGGSKSFKSWALLDLALCIATGHRWLDFAVTKGRVLYVNFEIQVPFIEGRLRKIATDAFYELEPGRLSLLNLRGHNTSAHIVIPRIIEMVKAAKGEAYSCIMLDPIYKLYGEEVDENSARDTGMLLNQIERISNETGAAVAYTSHFSKGNQAAKSSIDRISGSGVFARDPDSLLVFTSHAEEDAFTVEATLRNFAPIQPFVIKWDFPVFTRADLNPEDLKQPAGKKGGKPAKPEKSELDVLALVPLSPDRILKDELIQKASAAGIGVNRCRTFIDMLLEDKTIHSHRVKREHSRPFIYIARHAQGLEAAC